MAEVIVWSNLPKKLERAGILAAPGFSCDIDLEIRGKEFHVLTMVGVCTPLADCDFELSTFTG